MEHGQADPQSLKSYLASAWLPPIDLRPNLRKVDEMGYVRDWPRFGLESPGPKEPNKLKEPTLMKPPGTRKLKVVDEASIDRLLEVTQRYFAELPDAPVEWGNDSLNLPATGIIKLDQFSREDLTVDSRNRFAEVVMENVLYTVEEAMRMTARDEEDQDSAKFEKISYKVPVEAKQRKWDLFALRRPATEAGQPQWTAMVVLCISPGYFGRGDFLEFVRRRTFPDGRLDREYDAGADHTGSTWTPAETLWAVLQDACTTCGCRYFAVTTWNYWTFGTFSPRQLIAKLVDPIPRSGLRNRAGLTRPDMAELSFRPSLVQMIYTWCQIARGVGPPWPLPYEG
ncbi:hypothetical protein OE88DRAFT_1669496 [Heliocybe sulcata]|uniref:Uncharacterized protein n=1 Tax=Heliocybe sulcata TaxID=5364 RepID=A0A5C3MKL3_9AGAM|nr:hypothetical protein OE88DRAFT_1669496 [Heliocybe sulcata]